MKEIIVLDLEVDPSVGKGFARAVFWLVAPMNRFIPLPNFTSAVPVATTYATWAASTVFSSGTVVIPTAPNGLAYTSGGGTSGTTEPTWPTTPAGTVVNGGITFTCDAVDMNSGITAQELKLLRSGQVVEIFWVSNKQTLLSVLQTEIQTAYATYQMNLTNSAFGQRLFLESWNGTWSVPL